MSALTFSDAHGATLQWTPTHSQPADQAFSSFVAEHRRDDNQTFSIIDDASGDGLIVMYGHDVVIRTRTDPHTTEYRLVTHRRDHLSHVANFVWGGFAALDGLGRWHPDAESLERAQIGHQFDASVLRRTHPRELRRRLGVLTVLDGHPVVTVRGVTRYGWAADRGGQVNAWFTASGRGLVSTYEPSSHLNRSDDPVAQAAMYDGVPDDLVALARNVLPSGRTTSVEHPDGGTQVAATGVFTLAGPCALADGVVSALLGGHDIADTGLARLLEVFLAPSEFTPEMVKPIAPWWIAQQFDRDQVTRAASTVPTLPALPEAALVRFCELWAEHGYNDRWDVHHVFFDATSLEDARPAHSEVVELIGTLGLERVDAPPGAATGEVWVRTDERVDRMLGHEG